MLDRLAADDIPNIRFNVAKTYAVLVAALQRLPADATLVDVDKAVAAGRPAPSPSPRGQDLVQHQILPNLQKLQGDEDVDVRFFATTAAGGATGAAGGGSGDAMNVSP